MDANKRKRVIEKLRRLADPARNPNAEEVEAAIRKLDKLLLEEQKETKQSLDLRLKTEPFEIQVLLDLGRPPKPWEGSLFSFVCRINGVEGFYTVTDNGTKHFLRAAGRPHQLRKAEMQFLWATSRIQDAASCLGSGTRPEYRESYEHGAAVELVSVMKKVCEQNDNTEAKNWLESQTELKTTQAAVIQPVDPFWNAGKKALKKKLGT